MPGCPKMTSGTLKAHFLSELSQQLAFSSAAFSRDLQMMKKGEILMVAEQLAFARAEEHSPDCHSLGWMRNVASMCQRGSSQRLCIRTCGALGLPVNAHLQPAGVPAYTHMKVRTREVMPSSALPPKRLGYDYKSNTKWQLTIFLAPSDRLGPSF